LPMLVCLPPLFFAWSARAQCVPTLATIASALAATYLGGRIDAGTTLAVAAAGAGALTLGTVVAVGVSREMHARLVRRQAEEQALGALAESRDAQRESEERFRVAFHQAPIGMAMVGADGAILQTNSAFERMLGQTADEIVGTHIDGIVYPEDLDAVRARRQQFLEGEAASEELVFRLRHRDDHAVWIRLTRSLVHDRDGKPSYMIGQIEDVTERRRAEEALRTSERTFRSFAESMSAGVLIVQDGAIRYANAAVTHITGYTTDELLGQSMLFVVVPEHHGLAAERAAARWRGDEVSPRAEYRANTKSGEERWLDITVVGIEYRGRPALLGTGFDVTERKRAEHALKVSERMFRSFAESTAAGVLIVQDETIRYVNRAVTTITGFARADLVGLPLADLLDPADRDEALMRARARLHDESVPTRVEYRLRTKQGPPCWVDLTVTLIDHRGRPALLGTAFDITERRRAEEALRTSMEKLRRREEQLRLLAQRQVRVREEERRRLGFDLHDDVCQELVGTGILVESVRCRLDAADAESRDQLERVGRHLNALAEHLRLLARELRPMLLLDLGLEDSLRSLAGGMATAATRVTATFPTAIPRLDDEVEVAVYRVAQEAITNALRHAAAHEITVSLAVTDRVLRLEVRDDGCGFDADVRRSQALGLISMEERALALDGRLELTSDPGSGTSVRLVCPARQAQPRTAA
jgi:PAS domain S-box-containing protein